MTGDEAINVIHGIVGTDDTLEEAIDIAIGALEKQIPVKPEKLDELSHRVFYQCSKCKLHIYHDDRFCRHCGQAIDWLEV